MRRRPPINYYATSGLGLNSLGQAADQVSQMTQPTAASMVMSTTRPVLFVWSSIVLLSVGVSAYHGYKRNRDSMGSAVGWGLLGMLFPVITPAVAFAQGYAKPAVKANRRRKTMRRRTSRRRSR